MYFWRKQAPPQGIPTDQMGWYSDEYRVIGAADVHEVLAWADGQLPESDHYVLYVEQSLGDSPGLVRLAGSDPTEVDGSPAPWSGLGDST